MVPGSLVVDEIENMRVFVVAAAKNTLLER